MAVAQALAWRAAHASSETNPGVGLGPGGTADAGARRPRREPWAPPAPGPPVAPAAWPMGRPTRARPRRAVRPKEMGGRRRNAVAGVAIHEGHGLPDRATAAPRAPVPVRGHRAGLHKDRGAGRAECRRHLHRKHIAVPRKGVLATPCRHAPASPAAALVAQLPKSRASPATQPLAAARPIVGPMARAAAHSVKGLPRLVDCPKSGDVTTCMQPESSS